MSSLVSITSNLTQASWHSVVPAVQCSSTKSFLEETNRVQERPLAEVLGKHILKPLVDRLRRWITGTYEDSTKHVAMPRYDHMGNSRNSSRLLSKSVDYRGRVAVDESSTITFSTAAKLGTGEFVVAWKSNQPTIGYQWYDRDGISLGIKNNISSLGFGPMLYTKENNMKLFFTYNKTEFVVPLKPRQGLGQLQINNSSRTSVYEYPQALFYDSSGRPRIMLERSGVKALIVSINTGERFKMETPVAFSEFSGVYIKNKYIVLSSVISLHRQSRQLQLSIFDIEKKEFGTKHLFDLPIYKLFGMSGVEKSEDSFYIFSNFADDVDQGFFREECLESVLSRIDHPHLHLIMIHQKNGREKGVIGTIVLRLGCEN